MRLQEPKLRTLDEEITRCLETAEKYEIASKGQDISDLTRKGCQEIATEQRQLAEWLTELKEAKRLLKAAVKDFDKLVELVEYSDNNRGIGCIITDEGHHDECPLNDGMTCGWWHKDEALKLLGGSENV